jgi:hypothetical protein
MLKPRRRTTALLSNPTRSSDPALRRAAALLLLRGEERLRGGKERLRCEERLRLRRRTTAPAAKNACAAAKNYCAAAKNYCGEELLRCYCRDLLSLGERAVATAERLDQWELDGLAALLHADDTALDCLGRQLHAEDLTLWGQDAHDVDVWLEGALTAPGDAATDTAIPLRETATLDGVANLSTTTGDLTDSGHS